MMTPVSKAPAEEGQVPKARQAIRCRSTAGLGEAGARGTVGLQRAGLGRALTGLVPSGRGRATPAARTELGALGLGPQQASLGPTGCTPAAGWGLRGGASPQRLSHT